MTYDEQTESWESFFNGLSALRDLQEQQKQQGLNDFTALGSVLNPNDEVRLHTRFIYSLLNPHGKHYQGTRFLELFLECIGRAGWLNIDSTVVRKEYCPNGQSEQLDLYITDGDKEIVIENKLNAQDQPGQVIRYLDSVSARDPDSAKDKLFIYLTKDRSRPSQAGLRESKKSQSSETDRELRYLTVCAQTTNLLNEKGQPVAQYQNLWYRKSPKGMSIQRWIESCAGTVAGCENTTNIASAIADYKAVVERATREYVSNVKTLSEFFEDNSKEHLGLALQLASDLPSVQKRWLHTVMSEQLSQILRDESREGSLYELSIDDAKQLETFVQPSLKGKLQELFYDLNNNYFRGQRKAYRNRGVFYLVTDGPLASKVLLTLYYGSKALHAGCIFSQKPSSITEHRLKELGASTPEKLCEKKFPYAITLAVPLDYQGTVALAHFESSDQKALLEGMLTELGIAKG